MLARASASLRLAHTAKSFSVAGPCPVKNRRASSAKAWSRGGSGAVGARSSRSMYVCWLPRRGPLQTSASSSADISRYGRRWFSGLMPASLKTAAASARVSWWPPRSAATSACEPRRSVASSSPSSRYRPALPALIRVAVAVSSRRMSAGSTKCQVGRNTCVRRMAPAENACSTASSPAPFVRIPTAHLAGP